MTNGANSESVELPLYDVFDRKSLEALVTHILDSGALGRSKVYAHLLQYLINGTGAANSPKEIEIAMEVLGRDINFDVSKDSVVRVYIHQLRKKLDRYYRDKYPSKFGRRPGYRLVIPKGEYTIAAVQFQPDAQEGSASSNLASPNQVLSTRTIPVKVIPWMAATAILLLANIVLLLMATWPDRSSDLPLQTVAQHPLWLPLFSDDMPILVVVGDYYIFGELDEAGNVKRMIREFSINSKMDLEDLFMVQPELAWKYYDLDLSYIPEGSAFALNRVSALLPFANKAVDVKMMSELDTQDLTTHHIIYVGYISGLDRLKKMVFAASGLSIGENYDELINNLTQESYISSAGLPSFEEPFTDYGLLSSFPSTAQNRILIIAGMRDAGLIHTANAVADAIQLTTIESALQKSNADPTHELDAYEVLYQVQGLNRKNFNATLIYSTHLDPNRIWNYDVGGFAN